MTQCTICIYFHDITQNQAIFLLSLLLPSCHWNSFNDTTFLSKNRVFNWVQKSSMIYYSMETLFNCNSVSFNVTFNCKWSVIESLAILIYTINKLNLFIHLFTCLFICLFWCGPLSAYRQPTHTFLSLKHYTISRIVIALII